MRHEHIRFGTVGGSRLREPARRPPLQTPERRRALKTSEKQPKVSYESRRSGGSSSYTDFCAHLGLEFTRGHSVPAQKAWEARVWLVSLLGVQPWHIPRWTVQSPYRSMQSLDFHRITSAVRLRIQVVLYPARPVALNMKSC